MITLEAVVSGLGYGVLALLLGALMTGSFVLPHGEPAELRRRILLISSLLLLAFLVVAVLSLVVQGAKLNGGSIPSVDILSRYLLRTQSGNIWLAREAYAALLVFVNLWLLRSEKGAPRERLLFFLSLPLVASRSLTSHAIAVKENTMLVVSADALHLIATALWAGGLPVLFGILFQGIKRLNFPLTWAAEAVSRFSRLALLSVGVLLLTGTYQSWIHVQNLSVFFGSPYGRVLLLKLLFVLSMLGIGAVNFLSTRPVLLTAAQSNGENLPVKKRLLKRIGMESLLGLMVLSVTGFLTVLPPGVHSLHPASKAPGISGSQIQVGEKPQPAGGIKVTLLKLWDAIIRLHSGLQPAEGAKVTILSPQEGQLFSSDEILLKYQFVKGRRGNHLHAYVDGELVGMFGAPESGTLTGIRPGRHTVELRVVAEDHVTELDAIDSVHFVVK